MAETKRRLPIWMLKPHKETKAEKSDPNPQLEEKSEDQSEIKPSKSKPRRKTAIVDVEDQGRRRNNRNKRKKEVEIHEDETEGHGNSGVQRKRKKKITIDHEIDEFSPKFSADEIELTVDDLVSIAEEYVNADKEKQTSQASTSTTTLTNSSKSIQASLPNSNSNDFETTEINNHEEENTQTLFSKTGDAAQDMLDLFLGPLLKKSGPVHEPNLEPVEPTQSTSLYNEPNKMVMDEPIEKKKISLKDKVSLFLD